MTQSRCGRPDKVSTVTPSFVSWTEKFNKTDLTYRFAQMTPDLTPLQIRRAIMDGFSCWSAVTPLTFREVREGDDIVISFITESFDGPGDVLARGFGAGPFNFDEAEDWGGAFNLAWVTLHEIGHSLGLGHSTVPEATMNPWYGGTYAQLHWDDIHGIHTKYGWREPRWLQIGGPADPSNGGAAVTGLLAAGNLLYKLLANGQAWLYGGPPFGPNAWMQLAGVVNLAQLIVDSSTRTLYARTTSGAVLQYSGAGTAWTTLDINPDTVEIAAASGALYIRHFNATRNYAAIYKFMGLSAVPRWSLVDDNRRTRQIAVAGSSGQLYQLHDNGSLWRYTGPAIKWELISDQTAATAIVIGSKDVLYYLNPVG